MWSVQAHQLNVVCAGTPTECGLCRRARVTTLHGVTRKQSFSYGVQRSFHKKQIERQPPAVKRDAMNPTEHSSLLSTHDPWPPADTPKRTRRRLRRAPCLPRTTGWLSTCLAPKLTSAIQPSATPPATDQPPKTGLTGTGSQAHENKQVPHPKPKKEPTHCHAAQCLLAQKRLSPNSNSSE